MQLCTVKRWLKVKTIFVYFIEKSICKQSSYTLYLFHSRTMITNRSIFKQRKYLALKSTYVLLMNKFQLPFNFQEAKLILILDVCVSSKENPFDDLIKNYLFLTLEFKKTHFHFSYMIFNIIKKITLLCLLMILTMT